jgi:predicted DNA-binding transcriptional regulator YafY
MLKETNGLRTLKVKEIFEKYSDDESDLQLRDIQYYLTLEFGEGYQVSGPTLTHDIELLRKTGMTIETTTGPHNTKSYKYVNRKFNPHELRILVDAVTSARFLTSKASEQIIDKLSSLTSQHQAELLNHKLYLDGQVKIKNNKTQSWILLLHQAVQERTKVSFVYGKYNLDLEIEIYREGRPYIVEPYELVWNNEFYYLIGKEKAEESWKHYRVDRIQSMHVLYDQKFSRLEFDVSKYLKGLFHMYSGPVQKVKVLMHNHLINVVADRFGADVVLEKLESDFFVLSFNAAVSTGLLRWLLSWGSDAKVLEPEELVELVRKEAIGGCKINCVNSETKLL